MTSRWAGAILVVMLACAAAAPQTASQASPPPAKAQPPQTATPTFRATTKLVLVPVIVTDKHEQHMQGLKAEDFELDEDRHARKISTFEEVSAADAPIQRTPAPPGEFTNEFADASLARRLVIFALDDVNTPYLSQKETREHLIRFFSGNSYPNEPMALLTIRPDGMHVIHNFTTDTAVLAAALREVGSEMHLTAGAKANLEAPSMGQPGLTPLANTGSLGASALVAQQEAARVRQAMAASDRVFNQYQQRVAIILTLKALQEIAQAVAGVPGRKSLIWATAGFPWQFEAMDRVMTTEADLYPLYEETFRALDTANVAVYPVDVTGLGPTGTEEQATTLRFPQPVSRNGRTYTVGGTSAASASRSYDTYAAIAAATGGDYFMNSNDLGKLFADATRDSSSYYLLGFYLESSDSKPGWHTLKVRVHAPGAHARSRAGFFVEKPGDVASQRERDISIAASSPLDYTALPVTVRWLAVDKAKSTAEFSITLPPDSVDVDAQNGNRAAQTYAVVALDANGTVVANYAENLEGKLSAKAAEQFRTEPVVYRKSLRLKRGDYEVRFIVRDNVSGKMGSVMAPLELK